jgi:hypothetical protein
MNLKLYLTMYLCIFCQMYIQSTLGRGKIASIKSSLLDSGKIVLVSFYFN